MITLTEIMKLFTDNGLELTSDLWLVKEPTDTTLSLAFTYTFKASEDIICVIEACAPQSATYVHLKHLDAKYPIRLENLNWYKSHINNLDYVGDYPVEYDSDLLEFLKPAIQFILNSYRDGPDDGYI